MAPRCRRLVVALLTAAPLTLGLTGCDAGSEADVSTDREATPAARPDAPDAPGAATAPGGGPGPAAAAGAGEDCGVFTTPSHHDPLDLVRDFAARDSAGALAGGEDPWVDTALRCPDRRRGWDVARVVESYDLGEPFRSRDSMRVPVSYQQLGRIRDGTFEPDPRPVTDTFQLLLTPYGWRVAGQQMPNVSARYALRALQLDRESQARLEQLIR